VLGGWCAEIGRDPAEITKSVQLRFDGDLGALADEAAEFARAGADLAIVFLPPPHTPAVLEPLAKALEPLR
jgi:hypothetical protein